ncbi:hypothetical protein CBOM_08041 [Ceraceosorus bombacis]|uniref:Uncharacterized protein n=1 Tax=Ceraceosorus bombacis TaxID=401625 RepID=A0A0N7LAG8_9BASI|nr:hypothetical protein CBOM_08041 [Ceraceosorus bombacis]
MHTVHSATCQVSSMKTCHLVGSIESSPDEVLPFPEAPQRSSKQHRTRSSHAESKLTPCRFVLVLDRLRRLPCPRIGACYEEDRRSKRLLTW